ncbi:MAG: hypothetical protein RLZ98_2879 [Pseudomonadota bacterium]|jgi:drug/metabolite transporter (DMT)-like permease
MLGSLFALMSAIALGVHNAVARKGIISGTALQALAISLPTGAAVCLLATIAFGQVGAFLSLPWTAILWFSASGIVQFVVSRYLFYRATGAMGSNLAVVVLQAEVLFALIISMIVLGERLTPLRLLGILLVFVGPMLLAAPSKKPEPKPKSASAAAAPDAAPKWQPNHAEGFLFAILSSVGYGASFVLAKLGFNAIDAASSATVAASLVSFLAATTTLAVYLVVAGELRHVREVGKSAGQSFLLASGMAGLAVIFRYAALALVPVSVVAPIKRLSSIFTVLISTALNPDHEVFNARVIVASVVSFAGAVCLALSTDLVVSLLGLEGAAADWIRWEWP